MYELETLITTIPDSIRYLRGIVSAIPRAMPEGAEKVSTGDKPRSRPPLNVDALDAADLELASLAYWAEELGVSTRNIGPVWRVNGDVKGVLYDSPLAAEILTERVLEVVRAPHFVTPLEAEMHKRVNNVRAKHARLWPHLVEILEEATPDDDDD